jgi:hypothetical protein
MKTATLLILPAAMLLATATAAPQQQVPAGLPRDSHQGVALAVDAYTDAARSRARFGKKHPHDKGILPVEVFFENEGSQGVRLELERIELVIRRPDGTRQRLGPLGLEELLERMLAERAPTATTRRAPIPLPPTRSRRSKDWEKLEELLRPLLFEMTFLPPRATVKGFLFFDIGGRFGWLEGAYLYVPELYRMPENEALLFFEVPLAK